MVQGLSVKLLNEYGKLPNFLIIGAQKCGTSYIFNHLMSHPQIVKPSTKEVNYFSWLYSKGLEWYKNNFPEMYNTDENNKKIITGEATTNYLFHPLTPMRVKKIIPDVKIIVSLRNPIDRAYSHYQMSVKNGFETLPFEDAIAYEKERLNGEKEKIIKNGSYNSLSFKNFSYLSRGKYVEQLQNWLNYFPKEQFMIFSAEKLRNENSKILSEIYKFIDIPDWEPKILLRGNQGNYPEMNPDTRKKLIQYFEPHNEKLYRFLNRKFDWDQ